MEKIGIVAECLAAIALLWQVVVLLRQTKLFKHHATSQQLIGEVLQKQAEIMERQAQISEEAGRFTRRMADKEERETLFSCIQAMKAQVATVIQTTDINSNFVRDQDAVEAAWQTLAEYAVACHKELTVSIHLPLMLRNYFLDYTNRLVAVLQSRSAAPRTAQQLAAYRQELLVLDAEYVDFLKRMTETALTPDV